MKIVDKNSGTFEIKEEIRVNGKCFSGNSLYYVHKGKMKIEHQSILFKGTFDGKAAIKVSALGRGVSTYVLDDVEASLFSDYDEAEKMMNEVKRIHALPKTTIVLSVPNTTLDAFQLKLVNESASMSRNQKILKLIEAYASVGGAL